MHDAIQGYLTVKQEKIALRLMYPMADVYIFRSSDNQTGVCLSAVQVTVPILKL